MGLLDKLSKASGAVNDRLDKATQALQIANVDLTKQTKVLRELETKLELLKNSRTVGKQAAIHELEKKLGPIRQQVRKAEAIYNGATSAVTTATEALSHATEGLSKGIFDEITIPDVSIKLPSFPPALPPIPSLGALLPNLSLPLKTMLVVPNMGTLIPAIPDLPELESTVEGVVQGAAADAAKAAEEAALAKAAKAAGGIDKVSKRVRDEAKKIGERAGAAAAAANTAAAAALPKFGNISGPSGSFTAGKHIMEEIIATKTMSAPDMAATNSVSAPAATFGAINVVNLVGPMGTVTVTPSITSPLGIFSALAAPYKLFDIPHPDKEDMRLRHACIEGPEVAVYVRGKTSVGIIQLPDYWRHLVDYDSITVHLTPTSADQNLFVSLVSKENNQILVGGHMGEWSNMYHYYIMAERIDVEKLVVETNAPILEPYEEVNG